MKRFLFLFSLIFAIFCSIAQTYHPDDKEGLRIFLRQNGNFQKLGLQISDTLNWQTTETWVSKVKGLIWNNSSPKRVKKIDWYKSNLSGTLNCNKWEELVSADFFWNNITSLDINNNLSLTILDCRKNQLTSIDISNNYNLNTFRCSSNQLTELNVSSNTLLTFLECSTNQISTLDINANSNPNLTDLCCGMNKLANLDVSNLTLLIELDCSYNQLTSLNVDNCTSLWRLDCTGNKLATLDISKCQSLGSLFCPVNQLTTLELSSNIHLLELGCSHNYLSSLDVSSNLDLIFLSCSNNQFLSLEVSNNQNLLYLLCHDNQIASIEIDKNLILYDLKCHNNQLLFSKIPKLKVTFYEYSPQRTIFGGKIDYEKGIDLSEEYNINGNITQFSWFDITHDDEIPIELNGVNGFFSLTEDFEHKHLRCKMTNAEFPLLSGEKILVYEIFIGSCESVGNLTSEKINNNTILLNWTKPETTLQIEGYNVFRNSLLQNSVLLTDTVYLDENLPVGSYEYYVVAHYANGLCGGQFESCNGAY